ncbi:MAG: LexA family transcriptional regulator [Alphaproteobacteria bacterium]|nr:LexA family transcriptional regulator [Alphaproteobacteria bacterium]
MNEQWLQIQFQSFPHKSKSGLARALGLEPPAVSKILNGDRQIKAREYAIMREYFELPLDHNGVADHNYRLENFGNALDLQNKSARDGKDDWFVPASILQDKVKAPQKIKIFTIKDDLMAPSFNRGDSVLVDLSDRIPENPGSFAVSDGFGVVIRGCSILRKGSALQIKLEAPNPAFPSTVLSPDDFKILGRVVARLHWL